MQMQPKPFSEEPIVPILHEVETGTAAIVELCRIHGIAETMSAQGRVMCIMWRSGGRGEVGVWSSVVLDCIDNICLQ